MKRNYFAFILLMAVSSTQATTISLKANQWYIDGHISNPNSPAEGLLLNVRMVNSTFEDKNKPDFDSEENTKHFLEKIPEYRSYGVNAFTINLQGGFPGYEGAVNSAFTPTGSLHPEYMKRIKQVIDTCDQNGMAVILGLFYQRQDQILKDSAAVKIGVVNALHWIQNNKITNIIVEIANEHNHSGFDHNIIQSSKGEVELLTLAKKTAPNLLFSTSGLGNGKMAETIIPAMDFILIHFNGTKVADIPKRIQNLKKFNKPIICNEDDKTGEEGASALKACVTNGCSWGFMDNDRNQYVPFEFLGYKDDPAVYDTFKEMTKPRSASSTSKTTNP